MGVTGGRPDLGIAMTTGVLKPLSLISGELYTAKDENGELVGFTAWAPPGRATFDTYVNSIAKRRICTQKERPDRTSWRWDT